MPTAYQPTLDFHRLTAQHLPPEDGADAADTRRGFIGTEEHAEITTPDGRVIWSLRGYGFLQDDQAPETVNPSLWRQARLNMAHGLFEVVPGIYQVRGFDIANITFIESDTGLIALDALTTTETAAAALKLYRKHRDPEGKRRLHTVMVSHSHGDHFGGVLGLVTQADVDAGHVQVVTPVGFMHAAVAENVIAGVPMIRRGQFQFGHTLPKGPAGQVDAGLGKTMPLGRPSLVPPTLEITQAHETHEFDGVVVEFQLTPETEAPAEMHFYFPQFKALNLAENANHTLHNLCPLRGAAVRDALAWSKYLNVALHRYGPKTEVILAQHHWPTWGQAAACQYLAEQRDLYRVLHDQTVRLMCHGLKPAEIAEQLAGPAGLPGGTGQRWHARGYYGAVSHNVKAVYQRYLSWYDAHPANLHALPPVPAAIKFVEYAGGLDELLQKAQADFDRGEYRWVAEAMKHAVYAHPEHPGARELAAKALEQMGFQAESATWRNAYLLGAREYREGPPKQAGAVGLGLIHALSNEMLFDTLAIRVNAARAEAQGVAAFKLGWQFTTAGGTDEYWLMEYSLGALSSIRTPSAPACDARLCLTRSTLEGLLQQKLQPAEALASGQLRVEGNPLLLKTFFGMLDRFQGNFPVVDTAAAV